MSAVQEHKEFERTWDQLPADLGFYLDEYAEAGIIAKSKVTTKFFIVRSNSVFRMRRKITQAPDGTFAEKYTYTVKTGFQGNSLDTGEQMDEVELDISKDEFEAKDAPNLTFTRYQLPNRISIDVYDDIYLDENGIPTVDSELTGEKFSKLEIEVDSEVVLVNLSFEKDVLPYLPDELRSLDWSPRLCSDRSVNDFITEIGLEVQSELPGSVEMR